MTWLIALKDDPKDAELQRRIDLWCAASPENGQAYDEVNALWDLLGDLRDADGPDLTAQQAPEAGGNEGRMPVAEARRTGAGRLVAGGLALALATCLALVLVPGLLVWLAADHMTGTAELRQIRLEDGTSVTLGADSALDVAFEPDSRRVRLLSGVAFFDVTRDETRPFVVEANGSQTRVLGTSFEVGSSGGETVVAVASGQVRVIPEARDGAAPLDLATGDWSRLSDHGVVQRGRVPATGIATWRKGLLTANEESVAGIAEDIGRYYPGVILVVGPGLARQRVSGVYSAEDPVSALQAVADAHGAVLRQAGPWLLVLSSI